MAFIEPLALENWMINIFAGNTKYFTAIALLSIFGLAGYFRMVGIALIFMLILFFAMFKDYTDPAIYFLMLSVGTLMVGYWLSKIVKN